MNTLRAAVAVSCWAGAYRAGAILAQVIAALILVMVALVLVLRRRLGLARSAEH